MSEDGNGGRAAHHRDLVTIYIADDDDGKSLG